MVTKHTKYLITTESREIFIVRTWGNVSIQGFCPKCQKEVEMLNLDSITSQTGVSTRELFRLIENNQIHSIETTTGHLLVCRNSLEAMDKEKFIHKK